MELKKQGNFVFALISSLSSSELKQFKRFLKFEFTKASPYLKMVTFIEKYQDFDYVNDVFPEDLLLKKCGSEIEKNYAKLKFQLKQSVERFVGYLALKEVPKYDLKDFMYFIVKILLTYQAAFKLRLEKEVDVKLEMIAKDAIKNGYYAIAIQLYFVLSFFVNPIYSNKKMAIKRARQLRQYVTECIANLIYDNNLKFYNSIFSYIGNNVQLVKKDIKEFLKLTVNTPMISLKINHLIIRTKVFEILKDYQSILDTNLEIIEILKNHSKEIEFYTIPQFGVLSNAFKAAMHLNKEETAMGIIEDAEKFYTTVSVAQYKKMPLMKQNDFTILISLKLEYNLKFTFEKLELKSTLNSLENYVETDELSISPLNESYFFNKKIVYNYLIENYTSSYDIAYENILSKKLDVFSILCYVISIYKLFNIDFVEATYRNLKRTILKDTKIDEDELLLLNTIMLKLKKHKTTNDKRDKILIEIKELILSLKDDYLFLNKRIANAFLKDMQA